jgi:hypothetical protein
VSHNVTVPNPAIQSGFRVSLFVCLFGPASFDSGVLPLAPIRNPVLPLLTTLTAHSPPLGLLPCAVSPQPRTARYLQANIASPIPNHNTSRHAFSRAFRRCAPFLLIITIEAYRGLRYSAALFCNVLDIGLGLQLQSPLASFLAYHRHLVVQTAQLWRNGRLSLFPTLSSCTWLPKGLRVTYSQSARVN